MSDQELKPCPHCGSELDANEGSYSPLGKYYLSCMNHVCGYEGPVRGTLAEAIAATNTRTTDPMLEELAGALKRASNVGNFCTHDQEWLDGIVEKYQKSKVQP